MPAGRHGGNLDNNANTIGSIIHLPVKHEVCVVRNLQLIKKGGKEIHYLFFPLLTQGALLGIGDMHASMGDGEICGTGKLGRGGGGGEKPIKPPNSEPRLLKEQLQQPFPIFEPQEEIIRCSLSFTQLSLSCSSNLPLFCAPSRNAQVLR